MDRFLLVIVLSGLTTLVSAQQFSTAAAEIRFTSKAELELINANSNKVQGILDVSGRKFAFLVNVNSFQGFNSSLQRKHFNENYLESDQYPSAKFSGKIIEEVDLTAPGTYEVRAKGDLEIHGIKQTRIIKGKVTVAKNSIAIEATFTVPLTDHNITIPKIVSQKIATEILVDFKANLAPSS